MRDLVLFAFVAALLLFGLKRPFLFTLAYLYVDTVSPQRISYSLLSSMSISMVVAALAIGGWLAADRKEMRFTPRQGLILFLLLYVTGTTVYADLPLEAWTKWEWVWKAMLFAIFLPFTLRTKLRLEAALLFLCLSAAAIIIVGGIKTVAGGAGYGVLNLMVDNNSGLYESSTISTVAIALIPLILWFTRHGTIFTPDWRVKLFSGALIFSCLLIPIGTEARTGLICIALLGLLLLRDAKRRLLYIGAALALGAAAIPFLPSSFTNRMETIQGFKADESAGTRLAVWGWTWNYALDHPMGGGFEAYRQNRIQVSTVSDQGPGGDSQVSSVQSLADEGRAYHSAYFEMLGEQGFPGLIIFLLIHGIGVVRMEVIRRRYRRVEGEDAWIAPLATALQNFQLVYLVGALFVGIAYQPFVYLLIATQIGFDAWLSRRERATRKEGFGVAPLEGPERRAIPSL
ncbi:MAG TPA: putative O-glycosylation ligase, exosortase A system-associated [Allosphingosinicella sp.]|jgi:probable O-glycosylation ligase (exosortase A-associated)|nr:putative O-glycosylation ligase, exosortase A system-associated [Allosphingosinicella sp.]